MSLKETVLSRANIYKALYCMESYVFEKGLLSEEDLKMYVRLQDKYDFDYINNVIDECVKKLETLISDKNQLFDIEVYFKIKKWDEESQKIVFRPIHTARLIDQICMVCMLQPLMFDDRGNKRELSELTKLLPIIFMATFQVSMSITCLYHGRKNTRNIASKLSPIAVNIRRRTSTGLKYRLTLRISSLLSRPDSFSTMYCGHLYIHMIMRKTKRS